MLAELGDLSAALDFEDELVAADADVVAIGECDAGTKWAVLGPITPLADFKSVMTKLPPVSMITAWCLLTSSSYRTMSLSGRRPIRVIAPFRGIVPSGSVAQIGD